MKELSRKNAINIHSVIPLSQVNGPGSRMVVFFQGCGHNCSGCFNPATHPFHEVNRFTPKALFERYLVKDGSGNDVEGITVSGGDPFFQPEPLRQLLSVARESYRLSTMVYTGFTLEEIKGDLKRSLSLPFIDILIDGRYDPTKRETTLLARGSTNQRFHFLTERYDYDDITLPAKVEIRIARGGAVVETGFSQTVRGVYDQ
ncbi:MAG: 4Fe-4S single cluster domain-containing protein [Thermodesulfobacteriota bacterium]